MELPEKLYEVLKHEGVVSIVSWGNTEPHITNTWNSYIKIKEGNKERIQVFQGIEKLLPCFRVKGGGRFIKNE